MTIIQKGRGGGKTTTLIRMAHESGVPIVVKDYARRDNVIMMAADLGMNITVLTIHDVKRTPANHLQNVYFDDLDDFLRWELNGADVIAATTTGPDPEAHSRMETVLKVAAAAILVAWLSFSTICAIYLVFGK